MPLEQTIPIVYYKPQSPLILAIDFLYPYPPPNIRTSYNENILRIVEILTIEGVQPATWGKKLLTENKEVFGQWLAIQEQIQRAEAQGFSMEADAEKSWQQILPLM